MRQEDCEVALDIDMLKTNDRLVRAHDRQLGELIQTTKSLTTTVAALVKMTGETDYVTSTQFRWIIGGITGAMLLFSAYTVDKIQANQILLVKLIEREG